MQPISPVDFIQLREALDQKKWSFIKQTLPKLPTTLPSKASSKQLAYTLDTVRNAADCFTEACTFNTAYATVYFTREALLKAGVVQWAAAALKGFSSVITVVARLANLFNYLGLATNGRSFVGSTGSVDLLTEIWHKHPTCVEIAGALSSLCSGHIDNVSRVMRRRGLVVAIDILNDQRHLENPKLLNNVLLLVAFCAICTPDNEDEATRLVPAILAVLERLNKNDMSTIAIHAISAIGNMSECWLKESEGYLFNDMDRLVEAIILTWSTNSRSTSVIEAASRTLLVLPHSHPNAKAALLKHFYELKEAVSSRRKQDPISSTLLEMIDTIHENEAENETNASDRQNPTSETDPGETESSETKQDREAELEELILKQYLRKRKVQEALKKGFDQLRNDGIPSPKLFEQGTEVESRQPLGKRASISAVGSRKRKKISTTRSTDAGETPPSESPQPEHSSASYAAYMDRSVSGKGITIVDNSQASLNDVSTQDSRAHHQAAGCNSRRLTEGKVQSEEPSTCGSTTGIGTSCGEFQRRQSGRERRMPKKFEDNALKRYPSVERVPRTNNPRRMPQRSKRNATSESESRADSSRTRDVQGRSTSIRKHGQARNTRVGSSDCAPGVPEVIVISDDDDVGYVDHGEENQASVAGKKHESSPVHVCHANFGPHGTRRLSERMR